MLVLGVPGHVESPQVGLGEGASLLEVVVDHAEHLEHVTADIGALMARNAAIVLEQAISFFFRRRQRIVIAL